MTESDCFSLKVVESFPYFLFSLGNLARLSHKDRKEVEMSAMSECCAKTSLESIQSDRVEFGCRHETFSKNIFFVRKVELQTSCDGCAKKDYRSSKDI